MYYSLFGRCLIIISICFFLNPEKVSSVNIPIKRANEFKNPADIESRKSSLTEEQMKKLKLWPRGVIQYFIDDFSFDKVLRDKIRTFLEDTSTKTGESLQFVELPYPPNNDQDKWVFFINRVGQLDCADCSPNNFTDQGAQRILLGYDCLNEGNGGLAAIVLALAGVSPQHNAPNRDNYINIVQENILPDKKHLFISLSESDWVFSSFEYDFASAGHYDFYKYTSNGQATIKPMESVDFPVGDTTELSPTDIGKILYLYQNSKADLRPGMKEDCSKLYRPDNKIKSKPSRNVKDENNSINSLGKSIDPESSKFSKRGLKNILEKGTDYDTDLNRT